MKLNEKALASAMAIISAASYSVCALGLMLFPKYTIAILNSWLHIMGVRSTEGLTLSFPGLVFGLLTFTVVAWISGWVLAYLYNKFIGENE